MTPAQRAIVAARSIGPFSEAALAREKAGKSIDGTAGGRGKKKPLSGTQTRVRSTVEVGKMFKVHKDSVSQAKAILADAADLATGIEGCTLSLAEGYEQLQKRRREAAQKQRDAERAANYRDAVSNGEMTIEQAIEQVAKEEREQVQRKADDAAAISSRLFRDCSSRRRQLELHLWTRVDISSHE